MKKVDWFSIFVTTALLTFSVRTEAQQPEKIFRIGYPGLGRRYHVHCHRDGWLYLAVLLDLYSRRVVGWAMSETIDQQLVLDALTMALGQCRAQPGLIHHTDQGAPVLQHCLCRDAEKARHGAEHEPKGKLLRLTKRH